MAEMESLIKIRVNGGEPIPLVDLAAFWEQNHVEEAERPASCFLVVEDSEKPATWHLPVKDADGKPNHTLMGAAWAALHGGYRGNKYGGPNASEALEKLRALYKAEDMPLPTEEGEEETTPDIIEVAESDEGAVLMIGEGDANGYAGPVVMDVALIEPGFGNKKDNHYYPKETLERAAPKFEGVKMYLTNHVDTEHTVRNEVAEVLKCPVRFTSSGAPVARVGVFDVPFAENIRNRAKLGTLSNLQCSILGNGKVKRDAVEENGRKGHLVEDIVEIKSVDWVPRAGAGGRVLNLVEMEDNTVDEEKKVEEQESVIEEIHEQEKPQALDSSVVLPLLTKSELPEKLVSRLANRQWFKEEDLTAAISEMKDIAEELKEASPVRDMGASVATEKQKEPEKPLEEREIEILKRYGVIRERG